MPTQTWDLAVTELAYYIPSALPVLYCVWSYRKTALAGWLFMFGFIMLQIIGFGMIVSAGQDGNPSTAASIIIGVGLSSLLIGFEG